MENTLHIRRRLATIAVAAVLAGGALSGCSAVGGLSKAAGCAELAKAANTLSSAASAAMTDATSDPKGAAAKLGTAADKFDATVQKITDAGVKEKAQAMSSAYKKFTTDFKAYANDPANGDPTSITSDASAISDAASAVGKVCGGK
ncbi:hypothetical protein GCM10028798_16610 [Humibacter antri]